MQPATDVTTQAYAERVYAGVLGKVIGVYLGRPFEGWTYERIQRELGDIEYYVHDSLNVPLLVTDDDISGTFTFARALADYGYDANLSAAQIGQAWLNYLVENRTILWWGGLGNSTEHTAYLRLKQGIAAPDSGSAGLNGKVVSEQIGAQIFIDGWAMVSPGDAAQAARLAEQAARVSHDGEAVYGAVALAVMEAMAFVESDTQRLLEFALEHIPADSLIRRLIDDVRSWHAGESDWRATRERLAASYGYDKYGGNCHMVPNHGLIVHALLHGEDDFSETMKIVNTCGWDTDCNSGNLGCLMGIKLGLEGIDAPGAPDWRGPVADRIYVPTADPTWGISDCAAEAVYLASTARRMQGEPAWTPKDGAQFHFSLPGSVQGFTLTGGVGTLQHERGALALETAAEAHFGTPVFTPSKDIAKYFEKRGYALMASPRVYPGQQVCAELSGAGEAAVYIRYYGEQDQPQTLEGDTVVLGEAATTCTLDVPATAHPVFEVGVRVQAGHARLERVWWQGTPNASFARPSSGSMWRRAWVNAVDDLWSFAEPYRLMQNSGTGLLIQGTREWQDYAVAADVTPHMARRAGIAARVQGMRRYYALVLAAPGLVQLVCMCDGESVLAQAEYAWTFGQTCQLNLAVNGDQIVGQVSGPAGDVTLEATDTRLDCGGLALLVEEGRTATQVVQVSPVGA